MTITRFLFVGNRSEAGFGGAIEIGTPTVLQGTGSMSLTIADSTFIRNKAFIVGGAIFFSPGTGPSTLQLTNTLFAGNRSTASARFGPASVGGALAIMASNGAVNLTNCTLTKNVSVTGGGLWVTGTPAMSLTNTIAWGNSAPTGADVFANGTTLDLDHDDIGVLFNNGGSVNDMGGNLDTDPLLVNPPKDLHLTAGSPCVDAGTCAGAPLTDFEGDPRPSGARCDIGADEFVP